MAGVTTATAGFLAEYGSIISAATAVASGAMAAYSSYQGGKATEAAYNAQAKQDEANARRKALETSINEDTMRREGRQKLARMLAAQGEAGLVGGTAETAYMTSYRNTEQDAMNLRYQGMSQWANYKNQAALNRVYGKQAFRQGQLGAWTAGLSSLMSLGAKGLSSYSPNMGDASKIGTLSGTTGNTLATASPATLQSSMMRNPYNFGVFGGGTPW